MRPTGSPGSELFRLFFRKVVCGQWEDLTASFSNVVLAKQFGASGEAWQQTFQEGPEHSSLGSVVGPGRSEESGSALEASPFSSTNAFYYKSDGAVI